MQNLINLQYKLLNPMWRQADFNSIIKSDIRYHAETIAMGHLHLVQLLIFIYLTCRSHMFNWQMLDFFPGHMLLFHPPPPFQIFFWKYDIGPPFRFFLEIMIFVPPFQIFSGDMIRVPLPFPIVSGYMIFVAPFQVFFGDMIFFPLSEFFWIHDIFIPL